MPQIGPENRLAESLLQVLNRQFVYDFHLGPFILERCGFTGDSHEWIDLIEKMSIAYAVRKQHGKEARQSAEGE